MYMDEATKFCQHCGERIAEAAVICPKCGCQVGNFSAPAQSVQPNIIINNANTNTNTNTNTVNGAYGRPKSKWVAFFLCFFFGIFGIHKFYEGRVGMGILYILTLGIFGIGVLIDLLALLFKPNPYYV